MTGAATSTDALRTWSVAESLDLYAIKQWGRGIFSAARNGHLVAHPRARATSRDVGPAVDIKDLVDELARRGIETPILIRFPDVLAGRIIELNEAFGRAIEQYEYEGTYRGVYPIKVNQDYHVVRQIVAAGRPYQYGLEAGSKPELLAVMAMHNEPGGLVICNGYKDANYVETALLASKLGLEVILVVEKPGELELIDDVSRRVGIRAKLGLRVKLSARGSGRWEHSAGDRSKFGLGAHELMDATELMKQRGLLDDLALVHFHLGSQISSIRSIKNAVREAGRFYVELVRMGAGLKYFDVGGGLAVDYDGSQTNFDSSMNYTLQEYANDVVDGVGEICEDAEVPHPILVTESGRAVTAHHAVLVTDVLGVNSMTPRAPEPPAEEEASVVHKLWETHEALTRKNLMESYHDALDYKDETLQLFSLGHLPLTERVHAERIFWNVAHRIAKLVKSLPRVPEETEGLARALSDTYYCNFSVFQSLPDAWAVKQLFPVVPIHRLDEEPSRRAVLADITCDSDGEIARFIDPRDVKDTLEVHPLRPDESYHLGIFLVGAYQEILGDLHNLFGDTNTVHVVVGDDGQHTVEHVVEGDTVEEALAYVGYDRKGLMAKVRKATERALREHRMSPEECKTLMRIYEQGLTGYTYLERESV